MLWWDALATCFDVVVSSAQVAAPDAAREDNVAMDAAADGAPVPVRRSTMPGQGGGVALGLMEGVDGCLCFALTDVPLTRREYITLMTALRQSV
jgi:hypothetical protein